MRIILVCVTWVTWAMCAAVNAAEEPQKLSELREIFASEKAKVLKPLLENYAKALQHQEVEFTKKGDLDAALAFREERETVEMELTSLTPGVEKAPVEGDEKEKVRRVGQIVSHLSPQKSNIWHGPKAMKLANPFKTISAWAVVDGNSQGEMILILPSGEEITIRKWLGNEAEWQPKKKEIVSWRDMRRPLKIDISDHTKQAGDYTLLWRHLEGDGKLTILMVRMDY